MSEPEDNLEKLLAADEAAISDEGFTARVMDDVKTTRQWRRPVILGAGAIGAGFAIGGISELASRLKMDEWLTGVTNSVRASAAQVDLTHAAQTTPDSVQFAIVAVLAGLSFLIGAMALQSR
ncbi:MAG TPA: hypothetical protein VGO52_10475 [Hyphomonadaceae bacterium]|nr:hypothetical protein [Hyphomonadaceae bacterium]